MSQIVLLFSGQGAQKVGMGKEWAENSATARNLAAQADQVLGFSISDIMFEGPDEELTKTSRCQPALYLHGLMGLALIRERLPNLVPVAAAGLSLGEFTAHTAAGSFSFEDGLRLVARRGEFMEAACLATQGAMAALIGGDEAQVRALAAAADFQEILGKDNFFCELMDHGLGIERRHRVCAVRQRLPARGVRDRVGDELHREDRPVLAAICGLDHQRAGIPELFFSGLETFLVLRRIHIGLEAGTPIRDLGLDAERAANAVRAERLAAAAKCLLPT